MPDALDLTGDIATAVDGAALRHSTLALGFVRDDGSASVSFRGSVQVHSATELALWARNPTTGLATAIPERPRVSLVYYGGPDGPGPVFLSFEGRARLAPELNDEVYSKMIEGERQLDSERKGVAVLIEVDSVSGAGADGYFQQARA